MRSAFDLGLHGQFPSHRVTGFGNVRPGDGCLKGKQVTEACIHVIAASRMCSSVCEHVRNSAYDASVQAKQENRLTIYPALSVQPPRTTSILATINVGYGRSTGIR